ncbi:putative immunoglobulin-blocking virulence protein [Mycoplasmopsis caviae]|uniref:Immunoglobulin-blocking virulence protein n=1 Tax=Mycoplasmopsis caviae TaxID=55603 RepID=A0A3P8MF98_9BACT|nr:putative immunoglobulin-blocking virulence protein [Mycoplasmopsis caviae]UUD35110.1 putative immunoglobulin-blocking virulence protein [Mycoplasmopsis caviae]VDR42073.1 Uncharacterised protein [Mycoplasmopsis caviae]
MKLFKTKKGKILLMGLGSTVAVSVTSSVVLYQSFPKSDYSFSYLSSSSANPNFITSNTVDRRNSSNSIADSNLKEMPKATPNAPIVQPVTPVKPVKPIEPEKPREQPKPKPVTPQKSQTMIVREEKIINGVKVMVTIKKQVDRVVNQYDVEKGIANLEPYQNVIVSEIINVEVTEELRKANVKNVVDTLKGNRPEGRVLKAFTSTFTEEHLKKMTDEQMEKYIRDADQWNWDKLWHRYMRLYKSPKAANFLNDDAKLRWENSTDEIHKWGEKRKFLWWVNHLNHDKFTELGKGVEEWLKKGLTLSPDNIYIDENGNLNSFSASPPKEFNSVTSRIRRDNMEKRAFGWDSEYWRAPGDIAEGNFPGWTKTDATSEHKSSLGLSDDDGVKIYKYKKDKADGSKDEFTEGSILELDASNDKGYQKAINIINKIKSDPKGIVGYRIKNMGANDASQKFKDILSALPDEIRQLELWFSARATNTSSLIALENKTIKELAMYTLGNAYSDNWSFNPLSFRKTKFINTVDHNVNWNLREERASRITFDTLAFDSIDYNAGSSDPYERINLGLRMVYYARNNEPIFQGGFGPGLNPDHSEKGNSYPVGLDFSRIPQIKSLKGLVFRDTQKPDNGARKIKRLTLFNNSDLFEISADELNKAAFTEHIDNHPMSKAKLFFSNGSATRQIKITGTEKLNGTGLSNLAFMLDIAESISKQTEILAESDDNVSTLSSSGYTSKKASSGGGLNII